jgi:hypothetical protein
MTELPQIVIPRPGGEARPYKTPDKRWEEVTREMYGSSELPDSIHHRHDPVWNERFWSIQNAHDQSEGKKFGFWAIIGIIFVLMDMTWYFRVRF